MPTLRSFSYIFGYFLGQTDFFLESDISALFTALEFDRKNFIIAWELLSALVLPRSNKIDNLLRWNRETRSYIFSFLFFTFIGWNLIVRTRSTFWPRTKFQCSSQIICLKGPFLDFLQKTYGLLYFKKSGFKHFYFGFSYTVSLLNWSRYTSTVKLEEKKCTYILKMVLKCHFKIQTVEKLKTKNFYESSLNKHKGSTSFYKLPFSASTQRMWRQTLIKKITTIIPNHTRLPHQKTKRILGYEKRLAKYCTPFVCGFKSGACFQTNNIAYLFPIIEACTRDATLDFKNIYRSENKGTAAAKNWILEPGVLWLYGVIYYRNFLRFTVRLLNRR